MFLFGQGDLFVHFLDLSEELLDKPLSSTDLTRLNQLLQRALGACSVAVEPFEVRFAPSTHVSARRLDARLTLPGPPRSPVPPTSRRS